MVFASILNMQIWPLSFLFLFFFSSLSANPCSTSASGRALWSGLKSEKVFQNGIEVSGVVKVLNKQGIAYLRTKGDRIQNLKNKKIYVLSFSGAGAVSASRPESMIEKFKSFNDLNKSVDGSSSKTDLVFKRYDVYRDLQGKMISEVFPVPMADYSFGLHYENVRSLNDYIKLVDSHVREVKRHLPKDALLVADGRSFGGFIAMELAHRGIFDVAWTEGLFVPREDLIQGNMAALRKHVADNARRFEGRGKYRNKKHRDREIAKHLMEDPNYIDWQWMKWVEKMASQVSWFSSELGLTFAGRALLMLGGKDFEVSLAGRNLMESWGSSNAGIEYFFSKTAGHQVTKTSGLDSEKLIGVANFIYGLEYLDFQKKFKQQE